MKVGERFPRSAHAWRRSALHLRHRRAVAHRAPHLQDRAARVRGDGPARQLPPRVDQERGSARPRPVRRAADHAHAACAEGGRRDARGATPGALSSAESAGSKASWEAIKAQAQAAQAPVLLSQRVDGLFDILGDVVSAKADADHGARCRPRSRGRRPEGQEAKPGVEGAADLGVGSTKAILDLPATAQIAVRLHANTSKDAARIRPRTSRSPPSARTFRTPTKRRSRPHFAASATPPAPTARSASGSCRPARSRSVASPSRTRPPRRRRSVTSPRSTSSCRASRLAPKRRYVAVTIGKTVVENLPGDIQRIRLGKKDAKDDDKAKNEKKDGTEPRARTKDKKGARPRERSSRPRRPALARAERLRDRRGRHRSEGRAASGREERAGDEPRRRRQRQGGHRQPRRGRRVRALRRRAAWLPLRVGKPAPPTSAPLVFSFGKTRGGAVELEAKLDVANAALQDLIRNRSAF